MATVGATVAAEGENDRSYHVHLGVAVPLSTTRTSLGKSNSQLDQLAAAKSNSQLDQLALRAASQAAKSSTPQSTMTPRASSFSAKYLAPCGVFDSPGKGLHNPTKSLAPCKVHGKGSESTSMVSSPTEGSPTEASLVTALQTYEGESFEGKANCTTRGGEPNAASPGATFSASISTSMVSSPTVGSTTEVTYISSSIQAYPLQTSYGGGAANGPTLTGMPPKGDHGANRGTVTLVPNPQIRPARSNSLLSAINLATPDCSNLLPLDLPRSAKKHNNNERESSEPSNASIHTHARTHSFARILARVRSTPPPHFDSNDTFNESGHSFLRRNIL